MIAYFMHCSHDSHTINACIKSCFQKKIMFRKIFKVRQIVMNKTISPCKM